MKSDTRNNSADQDGHGVSRRKFLHGAGAAAGLTIIPRYVMGGPGYTSPSDKLNIAMIGAGGQGMQNINGLLPHEDVQIIAIADVAEWLDYSHSYHRVPGGRLPGRDRVTAHYANNATTENYPGCALFVDFREMLEQEPGIDAVVVSTPDHTHTTAALAAIQNGKHVYVEKPLARTIYETRKLTEAAREAGVVTQMGNQGHGDDGIRQTYEWIRDGAIGHVREVHVWSAGPSRDACQTGPPPEGPMAHGFDWDLWLGPAAQRPFSPEYIPTRWRPYWDFATGRLGDMGCHNMDPAFFALDLGYPEWVQARCAWGEDRDRRPYAATVYFQFPARGDMPPVRMTWYGGLMPPRPDELEPGEDLIGGGNGILFIGDDGKLMCPGWAGRPVLLPESRMRDYTPPPETLQRVGGIYRDWIDACKAGGEASANFEYSGPMTEVILMGVVAKRTDEKLYWDGPNMKATNLADADRYIRPEYQNGWVLP